MQECKLSLLRRFRRLGTLETKSEVDADPCCNCAVVERASDALGFSKTCSLRDISKRFSKAKIAPSTAFLTRQAINAARDKS